MLSLAMTVEAEFAGENLSETSAVAQLGAAQAQAVPKRLDRRDAVDRG
ncbi:hypothetical protein [Bradyrhizobium australiense]|uniref:Uncharacterized protein n=1 Tax=Bradyrhizobium australiense TaxID=2721161 RepID=A0A7Y4GUR7_9BRAD|nr:hypothetical protein [Bradyrhizobium australiense]NOJ42310.1 hypothetical protein [Bradyrhizobium australiense]